MAAVVRCAEHLLCHFSEHVRAYANGQGEPPVKSRSRELQTEGLTLDEASVVSGIGRTKLYEAVGNGQLTARKYGSRTIILRDDLMKFLASLPEVR